jgi:hypothetical protein
MYDQFLLKERILELEKIRKEYQEILNKVQWLLVPNPTDN